MTGVRFFNGFTKVTGWLPEKLIFRTKVYYEDKAVQGRRIKGPAIFVCNHTALFDYAALLFVFFFRTIRVQMAEVLYEKKLLGWYLRPMGGIRVNRVTHDFSFMEESERILRAGGVVGIFPESRLPKKDEARPLPFTSTAAVISLSSGVPVIPVYTNGAYFTKARARVVIGKPVDLSSLYDTGKSETDNVTFLTNLLRERVIELEKYIR